MTRKKNKNVSKNVPNGLILHTRDEYFESQGTYRKPGYQNRGNYRKAVVIDSNKNDDLAVVKIVSSGKKLKYSNLKYKPFVFHNFLHIKKILFTKALRCFPPRLFGTRFLANLLPSTSIIASLILSVNSFVKK